MLEYIYYIIKINLNNLAFKKNIIVDISSTTVHLNQ